MLAAMGTAVGLRQLGEMIGDARLHRAADHLGLDVTSVEGLWAAYASVWMSEMVATGFGTSIDKDQDLARIAGQAAALYELMAPGTMQQIARSGNFAALSQFATEAARAYADGRLRLTADGWAQGWTEVFPELTEEERRLADLPGFTAEQREAFILADPALNDGLSAHTGHAPEGDPVGNVISTPTPGPEGPNIMEARQGRDFTTPSGNVVRNHGTRSGEAYMLEKGHTSENVDEVLAFPAYSYPSEKGDTSTDGKDSTTVIVGNNGDWVMVNDVTGKIIQVNDRRNLCQ